MKDYLYGQFSPEHLETIKKGVELFDAQLYWECHEELEHHWLEDTADNARYIYWAVIQVAAAMIHFRDGNLEGAKGMIAKAKEKFHKSRAMGVETPLVLEQLSWERLRTLVLAVPDDCKLSDFEELFKFRFGKIKI